MKKIVFTILVLGLGYILIWYFSNVDEPQTEEPSITEPVPETPTNQPLTMDIINATFRVLNRSYTGEIGVTNTGTAVAFYQDDSYTYLLTNAHVVKIHQGYTYSTVSVVDYYGISHNAEIYVGSYQESVDLAILVIERVNVQPIEIKPKSVNIGEQVISIGYYPSASVTYGQVTSHDRIDYIVHMNVIGHSASIQSGASGGPLLNNNLELIGINYSSVTSSGQFIRAYSIPVNAVIEYLDAYFYI